MRIPNIFKKYIEAVLMIKSQAIPDNAYTHTALGCMYLEDGNYEKGVEELKKGREILFQQSDELSIYLSEICASEDPTKSITLLEESLHPGREDPYILVALGISYIRKGDLEKAIEMYGRALDVQPNNPYASLNIGSCYLNKARLENPLPFFREMMLEDALHFFEQADKDKNTRDYAYYLTACALYMLHETDRNFNGVVEYLNKAFASGKITYGQVEKDMKYGFFEQIEDTPEFREIVYGKEQHLQRM